MGAGLIGSAYKLNKLKRKLRKSRHQAGAAASFGSRSHLTPIQNGEGKPEAQHAANLQRLIDLIVASDQGPSEDSFKLVVERAQQHESAISRLDRWLGYQGLGEPTPGAKALKGMRFLKASLALLGMLSGVGLVAAVLGLDSGAQVNVLWFVGLVILQASISIATFIVYSRGAGSLPILGEIIDHIPNVIGKQSLEFLLSKGPLSDERLTELRKPFLFFCLQYFSLAFSVSALLALLSYIAMQDIGFGWSTTLSISPSSLNKFTELMAFPWAWIWSAAKPSLEVIQATQFFSADRFLSSASPLGAGWWPFLCMSWLFYAVLPRIVLWLLARRKWKVCSGSALLRHPLYSSTVDRLFFDHQLAIDRAVHVLSGTLVQMAAHVERSVSSGNEAVDLDGLKNRWQTSLLKFEQNAVDQLSDIFFKSPIRVGDPSLPDPEALFSPKAWMHYGLPKRESIAMGAAVGAGLGLVVDSGTGFATLGAASISGAVAGATIGGRYKVIEPNITNKGEAQIGPAGRSRTFCFALVGRLMDVLKAFLACNKKEFGGPSLDGRWSDAASLREKYELAKLFESVAKKDKIDVQKNIEDFLSKLVQRMLG